MAALKGKAYVPSRTEILLGSVSKRSRIIEIGPSFNPVAPKSEGWNSFSIDHLSSDGLTLKYAAHPGVDVNRIENVDFVWTTGTLSDAVPQEHHGSFDVFVASHVIEHTPDMVAFLESAADLLKEDGLVVLAVPDKRYCFDYFQPTTTTGQVLNAHREKRQRHSGERAFDHFAYAATDGNAESWGQRPIQGLRLIYEIQEAANTYALYSDSSHYHDLHAWHFTPASFELLLLELVTLGETDWCVERVSETTGWEFFAWLRRGAYTHTKVMSADELQLRRVALLKKGLLETQAQIDWLLASEPSLTEPPHGPSPWATPIAYEATKADLTQSHQRISELSNSLIEAERLSKVALSRAASLEASTSWRITAPIRRTLGWIRRYGTVRS